MFKAKNIIHKSLISNIGNVTNKNILDYGCGTGEAILLLLDSNGPNGNVTAVDCNSEALDRVKATYSKYILNSRLIIKECENPLALSEKYDACFCHNVLECINNKIEFVNLLKDRLNKDGILLLSHLDFDSGIYNSSNIELTRALIQHFADTKQAWQNYSDGQMGRKLPGIFHHSKFKEFQCETIRFVETQFNDDSYGFHMSQWIAECAKDNFSTQETTEWLNDLKILNDESEYFFAIDIVVVRAIV